MENKYQEALNRLHTSIYEHSVYLNYSSSSQPFEEDIKTLQELIDIHDIDYVVIAKQSQDLQKLEKALDKAIEVINKTNTKLTEKELVKNFGNWKEYLLNEVQDGQ